jgi:hypothetical protein
MVCDYGSVSASFSGVYLQVNAIATTSNDTRLQEFARRLISTDVDKRGTIAGVVQEVEELATESKSPSR